LSDQVINPFTTDIKKLVSWLIFLIADYVTRLLQVYAVAACQRLAMCSILGHTSTFERRPNFKLTRCTKASFHGALASKVANPSYQSLTAL
jgi:hypothetical protein